MNYPDGTSAVFATFRNTAARSAARIIYDAANARLWARLKAGESHEAEGAASVAEEQERLRARLRGIRG